MTTRWPAARSAGEILADSIQRRGIAAGGGAKSAPDVEVDVVRNEPRGAITKGSVHSNGMATASCDAFFIVGVRV